MYMHCQQSAHRDCWQATVEVPLHWRMPLGVQVFMLSGHQGRQGSMTEVPLATHARRTTWRCTRSCSTTG